MRNAAQSIASPNVGDPLPKDRAFCERFEPHGPTYCGMRDGDLVDGLCRDKGNIPTAQHLNAVIGNSQEGMLEIEHFPWNMDGQDLSSAIADDFTSKGKA